MPSPAVEMHLRSAGDTELLGGALARALPRAEESAAVLYLRGDLGAGKTTCVRSLLRMLGIVRPVRSPTYTLIESYDAAGRNCVHVDLYRLSGAADAEGLGLRDLATPGSVLLIEWPDKGGTAVPLPDLLLDLDYGGDGRSVRLTACTALGDRWLGNLGDDASLTSYVANKT